MLSSMEFVRRSLGLHLFFARIMKEHALFLQMGFTPRDNSFTQQADALRMEFDGLLGQTIPYADGIITPQILQSGEIVTPFTLDAEIATTFFTGIWIPTQLTKEEKELTSNGMITVSPLLEQSVFMLNNRAINGLTSLIQFKKDVLSNVLTCNMFTLNYPSLIAHILREAELYLLQLKRLQNREQPNPERETFELELFWGKQMVEHVEFIRGLLDPTENSLINRANSLIDQFNDVRNDFDQLITQAKTALDQSLQTIEIDNDVLKVAKEIRDFKAQGTQGILTCNIKSIIIPLLGDHVLREANHYLRILETHRGGLWDI